MNKPKKINVKALINRGIFCLLLIGITGNTYSNPSQPVLMDYHIAGNEQAPYFVPQILNFDVGTPYLLVIDNPFEDNINFIYEKLGQATYTYYLQGVSGVSQSSMSIPAQSKITWLLEINQPGEFLVYAMNMGTGQRGPASKLVVKARHQVNASRLPSFPENALLLSEASDDPQEAEINAENKIEPLKRPRLGGRQD